MSITRGEFLKALAGMGLLPSVLVGGGPEPTEAPPEPELAESTEEAPPAMEGMNAVFVHNDGRRTALDVITIDARHQMIDLTDADDLLRPERRYMAGPVEVEIEAHLPGSGLAIGETGGLIMRHGEITYTTGATVTEIVVGWADIGTCTFLANGGQVTRTTRDRGHVVLPE